MPPTTSKRIQVHDIVSIDASKRQKTEDSVDYIIPSTEILHHSKQDSDICNICAKIDFENAFRLTPTRTIGECIGSLGAISDVSSCRVCRFFAQMIPDIDIEENKGYRRGEFHLRALLASKCFGGTLANNHLTYPAVLAVYPGNRLPRKSFRSKGIQSWSVSLQRKGYICLRASESQSGFFGRRVLPMSVDYDIIKSWLGFCLDRHSCGGSVISVPGFRVLNCRTREIVYAESNCRYVALSYLWGVEIPDHGCSTVENILPSPTPRVIEDAIVVTINLGYDFLWIDRYCIDQNNAEEKHNQIHNMDSIYMGAALTIIAAAGEDASIGLPGVGLTHRPVQPWVKLGDVYLTSSLMDPQLEISHSKWSTRGWTYQEGLLSPRRLAFTSHQVYFQCQGIHCYESVDVPLSASNRETFQPLKSKYRVFPRGDVAERPEDFVQRVNEYSTRQLSFPTDILNAFLGVLKHFETIPKPINQIWGLPIVSNLQHVNDETLYRCGALAQSLTWESKTPVQRRKGFPSWSWVGWSRISGHGSPPLKKMNLDGRTDFQYDVKLSLELTDGRIIPWTFDNQDIPPECKRSDMLSRFIHIWGWTMTLGLERSSKMWDWRLLDPVMYGFAMPSLNVTMDHNDESSELTISGVSLGQQYRDHGTTLQMLLLGEEDGNFYRIGVMEIITGRKPFFRGSKWVVGNMEMERREFRVG